MSLSSTGPTSQEKSSKRKRKFIGFSEALEESRKRRNERLTPQPWIVRKLSVGIVIALWIYTYYVYVGRMAVGMITAHKLGSKGMGVVFIAIFSLLWLMFGWAYFKVIFTSPGYARDHVHGGPRPEFAANEPSRPSWDTDSYLSRDHVAGTPYENISPIQPSETSPHSPNGEHIGQHPLDIEKTMNGSLNHPAPVSHSQHQVPNSSPSDPIPMPPPAATSSAHQPTLQIPNPKLSPIHPRPNTAEQNVLELARAHNLPPPFFSRNPPTHPVLLPEYRYCSKEGFVKPFRAHHCRTCAKCVLQYDHHCPWIGQCVGARNRKFFIIFLGWSAIFTAWTFGTLLGPNAARSADTTDDVDAQQIVIIALSGVFTSFTVALFVSQLQLAMLNATTVEHINTQNMKRREQAVLSRIHSMCNFSAKRRTKKEWDREWGRIEKEGNIWWLGDSRTNFRTVMGNSVIAWFLPIGSSPDDGLNYPTNPRFDPDGRWRRRTEWPQELR